MYSVAIATYNGEKYIQEQLESIIQQSLPPSEIVISDDGSNDGTLIIIDQLIQNTPQIRWVVHRNSIKLGFVQNFESAILKCTEEYVFLSDQDDFWINNKAEILIQKLKSSSCSVVFSNAFLADSQLNPLNITMFDVTGFSKHKNRVWNSRFMDNLFIAGNIITGATLAFERDYILRLIPKPDSHYYIHDSWIAAISKLENKLCYIDQPLVYYRQHETNAIGVNLNKNSKSNTQLNHLMEDLDLRYRRELELLAYINSHNHFIQENSIVFLKKRREIYVSFFKPRHFLGRMLQLSPKLYIYKIPNFVTLRVFLGNSKLYLFNSYKKD